MFQEMKCTFNERFVKIDICNGKTEKFDMAVMNFKIEFTGPINLDIVNIVNILLIRLIIRVFQQLNITQQIKVNNKDYEEFNSTRTPRGANNFCDMMDGRGGNMDTLYLLCIFF